jgi:hypothetical protein
MRFVRVVPVIVFVIGGTLAATPAHAQLCAGAPSFGSGPLQVNVGGCWYCCILRRSWDAGRVVDLTGHERVEGNAVDGTG